MSVYDEEYNILMIFPGWSIAIGQNGAFGFDDWSTAVAGWYNEVNMFTYGRFYTLTTNPQWKDIAHYTQVSTQLSITL